MSDVIKVEINGVEYTGFQDVTISTSINEFVSTFSLTGSVKYNIENQERNLLTDIQEQDDVTIYINDIKYITGIIYDINDSLSASEHSITISGGDITIHLVDSTILPKTYTQRNFIDVINNVLSDNGWSTTFAVQSLVPSNELLFDAKEEVKTQSNETIFSFLQRYAEKVQVLLFTINDGTILIFREGDLGSIAGKFPSIQKSSTALINRLNNPTNNILESSFSRSLQGRYQNVDVYSQGSNDFNGVNSIVQKGSATDTLINTPRRQRISYNVPTFVSNLNNYAKWNINMKRAKSRKYNCIIQGIRMQPNNGDFWRVNTYVDLLDDTRNPNGKIIDGEYLIESVEFNQSVTSGTTTKLTIVPKGTYTLDIDKSLELLSKNNF